MVGIGVLDCISCIFYQSAVFVVPSLIFAYLMAVVVDYFVYSALFSSDMGIQIKILPTSYATIQALFVGLFIPIISSIVPIQRVMAKNISDSISTNRSQNKGSIITIIQNSSFNKAPYLLIGVILVIYGASIYVFLPLALISSNFGLLLLVFFGILMGMIFGLTIFVSNFQQLLEFILVEIFLFWEKVSMKQLVVKNLVAHRQRNVYTSLIYSLTIGTLIFMLVTLSIET